MGEGLEHVVDRAIATLDRSGADGVQELIWALSPQDQMRVFIELYNRRELEPIFAAIQDSFVHDMRPTGIPGMELYRGRAGYRRFLEEWLDAFPDSRVEIDTLETAGNVLLAAFRQEVHGAGSGVPVAFPYAAVVTFGAGPAETSEFHLDLEAARSRFDELTVAGRR